MNKSLNLFQIRGQFLFFEALFKLYKFLIFNRYKPDKELNKS